MDPFRMGARTKTRRVGAQLPRRHAVFLLVIPISIFAVFFAIPNVANFFLSLTDWNTYREEINFVGLENFATLSSNGAIWTDLRITLIFAAIVGVVQNITGLALALAFRNPTRWNVFWRSLAFIPVLLSPLATGYLFRGILSYDGPVNSALSSLVGAEVRIEWLASPDWTIVVLALVHSWKFFGLSMLIYIAGLSLIPPELDEAAEIDGANAWQRFWHINWRLLAPALTVNVTLTLVGTLNAFDVIFATTNGGPARSTEVFNLFVFQQFGAGAFGQSTAMALVLFLTVVAIAIPSVILLRRRELES